MRVYRRSLLALQSIVFALGGLMLSGCGGGTGGGSLAGPPISVSLSSPTLVVSADGTPTHVQILIHSTSETALVNFVGLPPNIQGTYQASDTNPSGLLTFAATGKVTGGTFMPIISVNSAGQMAMVEFTMIVATK